MCGWLGRSVEANWYGFVLDGFGPGSFLEIVMGLGAWGGVGSRCDGGIQGMAKLTVVQAVFMMLFALGWEKAQECDREKSIFLGY